MESSVKPDWVNVKPSSRSNRCRIKVGSQSTRRTHCDAEASVDGSWCYHDKSGQTGPPATESGSPSGRSAAEHATVAALTARAAPRGICFALLTPGDVWVLNTPFGESPRVSISAGGNRPRYNAG